MKTCIQCCTQQSLDAFSKHSGFSDGLRSSCKSCYNSYSKSDRDRFIRKIFATQRAASVKRGHPAPAYTLDWLTGWVKSQPAFPDLWKAYQDSGQLRELAPSVDRLNSNLPYTMDNLELVTWAVNDARGTQDTLMGKKVTQHRAVTAVNPDGTIFKSFISLHEAARAVGGNPTNIQRVADKATVVKPDGRTTVPKSSKGFEWRWS